MKVISSKNGEQTVRLSRKEWEAIGKKAGWDTNLIKESGQKLPQVSHHDLVSWVKNLGYRYINTEGSHAHFYQENPPPGKPKTVTIKIEKQDRDAGVLRNMLNELKIHRDYVNRNPRNWHKQWPPQQFWTK